MSKSLCLLLVSLLIPLADASPVVDTALWDNVRSPSLGNLSNADTWTRLHSNTPTKSSNSTGTLVSDFTLYGDFVFSGLMQPTYAVNDTCEQQLICNDNDIIGLVFGWQDESNHYRLGWSQGGLRDITGRTGLYLIREQDGISSTVIAWEDLFWLEGMEYRFELGRTGEQLFVSLSGTATHEPGTQSADIPQTPAQGLPVNIEYQFNDIAFLSGLVGVYTESQTVVFSDLQVAGVTAVPIVSSAALLFAGLLMMSAARVRARAAG